MDNLIVRSAVGRAAKVGDIYDVRSETFPCISILNDSPPKSTIQINDVPFTEIQYINSDELSEIFDKLSISTEMKASIISGLVSPEGHGMYFCNEKHSRKAIQSSMLYSIQTKLEQLDLFNKELRNYLALDALGMNFGTHIIVGVTWGANTIITLEHSNDQNEENNRIIFSLNEYLQIIANQINENNLTARETIEDIHDDISIKVFGDILPHGHQPQTLAETMDYIKNIPPMLRIANQGKGKQIKYRLVPISVLMKHLDVTTPNSDILPKTLDEPAVKTFINLFNEISKTKQQIYDLEQEFLCHKFCVRNENIESLIQIKNKVDNSKARLKEILGKTVRDIRTGSSSGDKLETIMFEFLKSDDSPEMIRINLKNYNVIKNKISFADAIKQKGAIYIGIDTSIKLEEVKPQYDNIYILYFGSELTYTNEKLWSDDMSFYLNLLSSINEENQAFIAVDLELRPEIPKNEGVGEGDRICQYKEGKYISFDVMTDCLKKKSICYAKSNSKYIACQTPNKRVILQLQCPGTINDNCEIIDQTWVCANCNQIIFYCYDNYLYCLCGRAPYVDFIFKCNSKMHVQDFIYFDEHCLTKLIERIEPLKEINVLILGVTGVGKSTWINAICNYMCYPSLESAAQGKLECVTSTSFEMTDDDDKVHNIKFGSDKNEVHIPGQSVTQQTRAYEFSMENFLLRLIDTPGIGDTRGQSQDKENVDAILEYLSTLDHLNGICILLKPNESRLDVFFEYCLKELLTHLHKSACKNIVFCFTNSRGTYYKPGDTRRPLNELLRSNRIEIELSPETMYCMDNESFRFLCAVNEGIKFKDNIKKSFSVSWNISLEETNRLLAYIINLSPHAIKDTLTINSARKSIISLTKPIADISQNIQRNISVAEDKKKEVIHSKFSEAELAKVLYMETTELKSIELAFPRTVCTNNKCVEYLNNEIKYMICHDRCKYKGVMTDIVGNPHLKRCSAMKWSLSKTCRNCGCKWDQHMHLTYEQISQTKRVIDQSIETQIIDEETARKQKELFIEETEKFCKELEDEQKKIMEVSVKFGYFLSKNAITPYNDALGRYLNHLIEKEEEKAEISQDRQTLNRMKDMLRAYEAEVAAFKQVMNQTNTVKLEPHEINLLMEELFSLKHNGHQLKEAMEKASSAKSKMIRYNVSSESAVPLVPINYTNLKVGAKIIKAIYNLIPSIGPQNLSAGTSYSSTGINPYFDERPVRGKVNTMKEKFENISKNEKNNDREKQQRKADKKAQKERNKQIKQEKQNNSYGSNFYKN